MDADFLQFNVLDVVMEMDWTVATKCPSDQQMPPCAHVQDHSVICPTLS